MRVSEIDEDFCREQVSLRIAELLFNMGDIDNAIYRLAKVEGHMQNKDKYLLYLLKGKCYDKKKQFKQAILQYE